MQFGSLMPSTSHRLLLNLSSLPSVFGVWFAWKKSGAEPTSLSFKGRAIVVLAFAACWLAFAPYLKSVGAVAIWSDTFGLLGSLIAQVIMVKEKWETWALWFAVDIVLTIQYFRG